MPGKQNKKGKNGKVQKSMRLNYGPAMHVQERAIRVLLPWSWSASLSETAAGAGGSYSFAVNNCFDPNFTGAGSQPLGFDQYAALYGRYRVLKVRYDLQFGSRNATSSERFGFFFSPQSTLTADPNAWPVQNKTAKMTVVSNVNAGNSTGRFSGTVDLASVFGVTKPEFEIEHDFVAGTGAGPTRTAYMHIFIICGTGATGVMDYTLRLWMETEFSNPVALALS